MPSADVLHPVSLLLSMAGLIIGALSLGGTHQDALRWGYGKFELNTGCKNEFTLGLNWYKIDNSGDCEDVLPGSVGGTNGGGFTNTAACNVDFYGDSSNAMCRSCADVSLFIIPAISIACFMIPFASIGIIGRLNKVPDSVSQASGVKTFTTIILLLGSLLFMLSFTLFIVGCQNIFISYLDTVGQSDEVEGLGYSSSWDMGRGLILCIVAAGVMGLAAFIQICLPIVPPEEITKDVAKDVEMDRAEVKKEEQHGNVEG
eukprot:CAMPEP_0170178020 /NCGR_PEP_ID=MMETSP0040_2-20121228/11615_1 /TAXON_ID=641309 /ORGANISM="Lotharella oceanica, Strain CCMP622" /LENGTH=258 /DNA_ID=CAMNT_0010420967 /DNA_START=8 /DNA_END=784 /DNA_ORIENTATION=+